MDRFIDIQGNMLKSYFLNLKSNMDRFIAEVIKHSSEDEVFI